MQKIRVTVDGCDDCTMVEIEVSLIELAIIETLAQKITETSIYACMPRMTVEKL